MKLLRTKAVGVLALEGLASVTVVPVAWVGKKVSKEYRQVKADVTAEWAKENWDQLSAQDRFDVMLANPTALAFKDDPVCVNYFKLAGATRDVTMEGNESKAKTAIADLVNLGVRDFGKKFNRAWTSTIKTLITLTDAVAEEAAAAAKKEEAAIKA